MPEQRRDKQFGPADARSFGLRFQSPAAALERRHSAHHCSALPAELVRPARESRQCRAQRHDPVCLHLGDCRPRPNLGHSAGRHRPIGAGHRFVERRDRVLLFEQRARNGWVDVGVGGLLRIRRSVDRRSHQRIARRLCAGGADRRDARDERGPVRLRCRRFRRNAGPSAREPFAIRRLQDLRRIDARLYRRRRHHRLDVPCQEDRLRTPF